MSGRGRSNRGGRSYNNRSGGRGRGKPKSNSQSSYHAAKPVARKTLADHVYSIGSAKQASDYSVITQFIINHIRKTFEYGDNIGGALEARQEPAFTAPTLEPSKETEAAAKALEEKQNEILYRALVATYVARMDKYIANKGKAFALIIGQCNKALQHKLQSRVDYETTIKGDPIKLLDAISEHSMSYVENKYPYSTTVDAIKNYINIKQTEDELLVDYTRRFKAAKKIMETQIGGELQLPKLAQLDPKV